MRGIWQKFCRWVQRTQLVGAIIGGLLVGGGSSIQSWQEREWTRETLASAFIGEISAIVEHRNTRYLKEVYDDLGKGQVWEPIGQPPERHFVIFEASAENLVH